MHDRKLLLLITLLAIVNDSSGSDWLLDGSKYTAKFANSTAGENRFTLENGITSRTFLLKDSTAATINLTSQPHDESLIRAIRPEAVVTVGGIRFEVGGLTGQPNHAYLRDEWIAQMKPASSAMKFVGHQVGKPEAPFAWKRVRHHAPNVEWPPAGTKLTLNFRSPKEIDGKPVPNFRVSVHYELYDGVPLFCKWLTLENQSDREITIDHFTAETLALVEHDSRVETRDGVPLPRPDRLHVETDFAFGGFVQENANRHVVHYKIDPEYKTQVNYKRETPCLLVVEPTNGPAQTVKPGGQFKGFRVFQLVYDSDERERRSLSLRRMYRTVAPWVTENPLMHHMRIADPQAVRRAIDDAAKVGFEMIILSFGSGFNIENDSPAYVRQWREIAAYARSKKIEIGGYSLLSSRRIGGGNDIVSPKGVKPTHGNCPALTSEWGQAYYKNLYRFFEETGFTLLEHDGPYPGDVDVTPRPPLQRGEADSRWVQGHIANEFYRWCRAEGIYVNAPDFYFLNGTNKCGMGYREVNWSLPRAMQLIHTRQNIFDGTWYKTPSMGWMFVPLTEYHGGGAPATIEPLDQHLDHYERMIQSNLALGVQPCFRGPRLFDTDRTRDRLKGNVDWFKKYRNILESDVIHGRRADGRDLDWMLHVNPNLDRQGMLLVFNPTKKSIRKRLRVNLYYTGIETSVLIKEKDQRATTLPLNRDYSVEVEVNVPAESMNWFVLTNAQN